MPGLYVLVRSALQKEGLVSAAGREAWMRRRLGPGLVLAGMLPLLGSCGWIADGLWLQAGNRAFQEGRLHDALAAYHQVTGAELADRGRYNMANVYILAGEPAAAEHLYQELTGSPDGEVAIAAAYNLGMMLMGQQRHAEAVPVLRQALERGPAEPVLSMAYEAALQVSRPVAGPSDREWSPAATGSTTDTSAIMEALLGAEADRFLPGRSLLKPGVDH